MMRIQIKVWAALIVACVVLVSFTPLLNVGFFGEDHSILGYAAQLQWSEFAGRYLDFSHSASFYRPVEGLLEWIQYQLFGDNTIGYRVVAIAAHLANCLLLYLLVSHLTHRYQLGLVAALVYSGLPAIKSSFFWITVPERFVAFFYLLALLLWILYLERKQARYYLFTVIVFVLGILTKEIGVTLIAAIFLMDRWLVGEPLSISRVVKRYLPFALILLVFAASYAQRLRAFTTGGYEGPYAGMGLGIHNLTNFIFYIAALAYPWNENWPASLIWLVVLLPILVYFIFVKRNRPLAFLSVVAILPVLPVLPFTFAGERYLYLSMMVPAIFFALGFERLRGLWGRNGWAYTIGAVSIALILVSNANVDSDAFEGVSVLVKQFRAPVRPIFQRHPAFDSDTYLYFIDSPIITDILSGMFALHYGKQVSVGGTDYVRPAELHIHPRTYVYSFDDQRTAVEHPVSPEATVRYDPALPIVFNDQIRLESFEVANQSVKRGQDLILILYWQAMGKIDRDYTLFAHLVDSKGNMVASSDSQPRGGKLPTSKWQPNRTVLDWVVLPIPEDVQFDNNYRLEIGWYYLPTMESLGITEPASQVRNDHLTLDAFSVSE